MKLYTLLENTTASPHLRTEHGLSLYLEACGHRILFDYGASDAFLFNARQLGVDLNEVDIAILSHGHYDHGGGLPFFLEQNTHAPLYLNRHAFGKFYSARGTYIGLAESLPAHPQLQPIAGTLILDDGLTLMDCNECSAVAPLNAYGLMKLQDGKPIADDFLHEQYLLIEENGKRILVSGCSHKGILNLVEWFKPDILIGGFHFMAETDTEFLCRCAHKLQEYPTVYYTGHCTGESQYQTMKEIMDNQLQQIQTGTILEF